MLRTPRTYVAIALGLGAATVAALASYSHLAARTPARQAPLETTSTAPQTFQAYSVLHGLPPRPAKRTNRHGKLRLTRMHGKYFLAGADNHYYLAGRDRQGHLVPVYHDPATEKDYPLYYDRDRDRYYRITEDSQTHQFYRNYEGDPEDRFYQDDRNSGDGQEYAQNQGDNGDYSGSENYQPAPEDQPDIITADSNGGSDDWLLAVPVIAAAFLLLPPRHHHSPHFTPPSDMVVAVPPARSHGTLPGPRPHVANPPIILHTPVVPMTNGKPSIPNPSVLTHRWIPPGSTSVTPPPAVVAMNRTPPPAKPPLFQRPASQVAAFPGSATVASRHHPVPVIHAAPSAHTATAVAHNVEPVIGHQASISSRPVVHVPASETMRQTGSWQSPATRPAGKATQGHVASAAEPHIIQAATRPSHKDTTSETRTESAAPVAAARMMYPQTRPASTEHAPVKPAATTSVRRETSSASSTGNRSQAPQEVSRPAAPPARQSNPPSAPAREESRPSNPPRPPANEEHRAQQPASPPPASHSAPAEQPRYTPQEPPQRTAPAPEPPRAAPSAPPRSAPAPEPSHNNENHGNDNNSGGNNGGKVKK